MTETEAERDARQLDADFERLFAGAFGLPQQRLWMLLDGAKVQQRWTRQQLVEQALQRPAGMGKVEGHPFLLVDPNLTAGTVQAVLGQGSLSGQKMTAAEGLEVGKRLAAHAIRDVGGDWSLYALSLPDWALTALRGWASTDAPTRVKVLDQLDQHTMLTLTKLVTPAQGSSPAVAGMDWTTEAGN